MTEKELFEGGYKLGYKTGKCWAINLLYAKVDELDHENQCQYADDQNRDEVQVNNAIMLVLEKLANDLLESTL